MTSIETSSPRSSVNVHRSNTSRRPYLSLDTPEYSLTDGTDIPAPSVPEIQPTSESPVSSINEQDRKTEREAQKAKPQPGKLTTQHTSSSNGPLSSHPVTPIEKVNGSDRGGFPFNRQPSGSVSSATNYQNGASNRPTTPTASSPLSQRQQNGFRVPGQTMTSPPSTEPNKQELQPAPGQTATSAPQQKTRKRRASFAERFLRFRSLSSLRNPNNSQHSFPRQQTHGSDGQFAEAANTRASAEALGNNTWSGPRGVKRPGSPSIAGLFRSAEPTEVDRPTDGSRPISQSFPRMMRKKSMELLGTARRKSGMWTGGERHTMNDVMREEYERERMRESEMDNETEGGKSSMAQEGGRISKVSTRQSESIREPPPTLPELGGFQEMQGEDMFSRIGKEE